MILVVRAAGFGWFCRGLVLVAGGCSLQHPALVDMQDDAGVLRPITDRGPPGGGDVRVAPIDRPLPSEDLPRPFDDLLPAPEDRLPPPEDLPRPIDENLLPAVDIPPPPVDLPPPPVDIPPPPVDLPPPPVDLPPPPVDIPMTPAAIAAGSPCTPGGPACESGAACFVFGAGAAFCERCGRFGQRPCPGAVCREGIYNAPSDSCIRTAGGAFGQPGGACVRSSDCGALGQCVYVGGLSRACIECGGRGQACCCPTGLSSSCACNGARCLLGSTYWTVCY